MKLFKDTKRVIRKVYLCNKYPLTIFKRLFLTKTTSNLLSKDRLHRWYRKKLIGMDWLIPLATITQTLSWLEGLVLSQSYKCLQWVEIQIKWETRWTDYNTCNMNALKRNSKRNMIKELTFCTRELKKSSHIKVHIKTLISFWCKIALMTSIKLHQNKLQRTKLAELATGHQIGKMAVSFCQEWGKRRAKREEIRLRISKIVTINRIMAKIGNKDFKMELMHTVQMELKSKRRNNTSSFTLTVLRKL